jgi:F-type H+-transporting ATPase subunit c
MEVFMLSLAGIGAGIAVFTGLGAGIGIGIATNGATQAIARQPEAKGEINKTLILGCALAEATAIYGLVIAFLVIFVK